MRNLIKEFEGLSLEPYLCPANVATIGFGNTRYQDGTRVTMSDKPLTLEQAEALFSFYHDKFKASVSKRVKSDINDNQLEALTSFAYNVGLGNLDKSTLLKKVNLNPKDLTIKAEFLKWNKGGGKVLNGLIKRREAEAALYFVVQYQHKESNLIKMKLSNNLELVEVTRSATAKRKGIINEPTIEDVTNLKELANKVFQPIRDYFNAPIFISSGYRSKALNKAIGGSSSSQHCKGEAIDIDMDGSSSGVTNADVFNFIKNNLDFDQLIWEFGTVNNPNWVHVSYSTNNRKQILKAVKTNGKTSYIKFS